MSYRGGGKKRPFRSLSLHVQTWPLCVSVASGTHPYKRKKYSTRTELPDLKKIKKSEICFMFLHVTLGAKAQSFLTVISPQALSLKVFHKLGRAVLRMHHWELRLLEEGSSSPLLDIYKNRGLHLSWQWEKWALPGEDSPYLIDDVENS